MEIDDKLITQLSRLSKLEFKEEEKGEIKSDLNKMLSFVEKLNEVDTENVEPLIYLTEGFQETRKDEVTTQLSQKEALKNAPQKDSDYFKVPRFLNKKNQ